MPNGLSDGAIIIDTGMDNSDFFRDAKAFKAAVQGLKNTVNRVGAEMGKSGGAFGRAVQNNAKASREFESQLRQLERQAEALKATLDKPGEGSQAYKAVEDEIKAVEAQFDKAIEKRDALVGDNGQVAASNVGQYRHWNAEVERLAAKLGELEAKQQAIANPTGDDIAQYQQRVNAYNQVVAKLAEMRQAMADIKTPWVGDWQRMVGLSDMVAQGFSKVRAVFGTLGQAAQHPVQAVDRLTGALARMVGSGALSFLRKLAAGAKNAAIQLAKLAGRTIANAAKSLFSLGRGARQSGQGFQFSLKNMLKYGLGIRSLFVLFNRLRSAIKQGFETLANYDPRVQAALASLKGALNGLKGSLAGAFAPILTAVAPALTTLINLLTQAVNAIGMFMAAITGQAYYNAAKGIGAIGGAAGGAGGAVKELKRQLAGFDELNILTANSGGGGGGGGGGAAGGYNYEQMPIAGAIAEFANQMRALIAAEDWDGLGRLLADKVNGAFDRARAFIRWDNLGAKISGVVDAVTGTINGLVNGVNWTNIGATFAEGLNTITNTLLQWYSGIEWEEIGTDIGEAINGFFDRVDWPNIGNLVRKKAGSIVSILKGAVTTIEWGDAGKKLSSAINAFFSDPKIWEDAGTVVNKSIRGILDFSKNFIIEFDAKQAGQRVRDALGKIEWENIGRDLWDTAKVAFKKAGDFINALLGEDNGKSAIYNLGVKIGQALGSIPWGEIFSAVKQAVLNAFRGLIDGLLNSSNGTIIIEIGVAIAGLKIAIGGLIAGLKMKIAADIAGIGTEGASAFAGAGTRLGNAALLAFDAVMIAYDYHKIKEAAEGYKEAGKAYENSISTALDNYKKLYDTKGKDVADAWAKQVYNIDTSNSDLEQAQQSLVDRCTELWGDAPKNWHEALVQGWNHYFGKGGKGIGGLLGDAGNSLFEWLGIWHDDPPTDKGPNGDYTLSLEPADKKWGEIQRAVEANTKATKSETKAQEESTRQNEPVGLPSPGELSQMGYLTGGEVDVGVNFTPQGAGGQGYTNNLGGFLKKIFAPGADTEVRTDYVKADPNDTPENMFGDKLTVNATLKKMANTVTVGGLYGTTLGVESSLKRAPNSSTVTDLYPTKITVQATLIKKPGNKLTYSIGSVANGSKVVVQAMGGIITAGGRALGFARGGYLSGSGRGNWWRSATKYAGGTNRAHGTMFVAGEAGPEIVGHVNGRTEILNQSQLAQTMRSAVASGMIAALRGITFTLPAMATGGVVPYEVSAQIAKSTADLQNTLNANNEDLIQTIISVAGQLAAALQRNATRPATGGSMTDREIGQAAISEINRITLMRGQSPLKGV